ncbi:MAG TPA: hypothetical protein VI837_14235 [Blastocatellia bacterium]|nr:hypothetical protein [Blastocatellia bacterium]
MLTVTAQPKTLNRIVAGWAAWQLITLNGMKSPALCLELSFDITAREQATDGKP